MANTRQLQRMITPDDGKLYYFLDRFFDDNQKDTLCINFLTSLVCSRIFEFFLRRAMDEREIFEECELFKVKAGRFIYFIEIDNKCNKVEILRKPANFFGRWEDLNLPLDLQNMLLPIKKKSHMKSAMHKIMKMKVFW